MAASTKRLASNLWIDKFADRPGKPGLFAFRRAFYVVPFDRSAFVADKQGEIFNPVT
ncbi:hypothetical protein BSS2_I1699 [Brucella suis bv. 1 str. S2]|uniref:Uncharacterized protein n=9 Tax=Brucella TaxID=234 RepID=Q2YLX0_BRUA2|nr:hypothetical protein BR1754 [Brucella suis 1330]AAX75057.1 hypothetical protein BruAb1_1739 [Brucella abortus bv. 1 str. 9-941]ACU48723.1 hypothetical protein BMI_I1773 [Brucella microti CCM 4915]ADZ66829.1 conserved hypothetical protein [Brucella melitensis M28]ADZ87693.1 conserved hypothetical protein [Brucella melitensis M5-90]AEK55049.1 hypothetical protein BPI_I1814 [Brucella pinnipedialis B2/94]AEU06740.1 hypothetical protein BSVBI22_A1750 [Brucella suis VBI22]AHN47348.1 hypothetica